MARNKMTMNYGSDDATVSISAVSISPTAIAPANGAVVEDYFRAKDNSAYLLMDVTVAGSMKLKAGDAYPSNSCLGDLDIDLPVGKHLVMVERSARFENRGGSLNIDFAESTAGTICAFGKKAGLR